MTDSLSLIWIFGVPMFYWLILSVLIVAVLGFVICVWRRHRGLKRILNRIDRKYGK